jgi:murein DD-endopeptidase MepM/ murein hydrolase activator NlpD
MKRIHLVFFGLAVFLLAAALTVEAGPRGKKGKMGKGKQPVAAEQVEAVAGEGVTGQDVTGEDVALDPEVATAFIPLKASKSEMRARGFFATGLKPVYPEDAACPKVDSAFAARTRGDGSRRSRKYYNGYHGGLDIPVPEGTPIRAVARGEVLHKSAGQGGIGGLAIVLRHAPEDTGLPVWLFTEYKHLKKMPDLKKKQIVEMGEAFALAGRTGTIGGYYGPAGHSHLHLTAFYNNNGEFRAGRMLIPLDGYWMDPLAMYKGPPLDSGTIKELPGEAKAVAIPFIDAEGRVSPEGALLVWPFACPTP